MMPIDELVSAAPDTCWGMVGGHLMLFDPATRRLHVLNDTAAMIWALTDEGTQVRDLVTRLGAEFHAEPSAIQADVIDVVDQLIDLRVCLTGPAPKVEPRKPAPQVKSVRIVPSAAILGPYDVLGSDVYVDVRDRDLRTELLRALAPLRRTRPTIGAGLYYRIEMIDGTCQVSLNGKVIARGSNRATARRTLLADLNVTPLEMIEDALALHAGAAEIGGRIVAFPGASESGKSTLVVQLMERGHGYLTDEALVIDHFDLVARPYPKSLCIDPGSQAALAHLRPPSSPVHDRSWDIDPGTVGDGRISAGGPIGAIVFGSYQAGADATVRALEPVDVMHRLLANSFSVPVLDQAGFAALIRLANGVLAFELVHGGVGHLPLIESAVASSPLPARPTISL